MIGDCGHSQCLLRLAAGPSAGERQALAAKLIDLLIEPEADLNERGAALIGDILCRLVRDFDPAIRRDLAHRLAGLALAPREICVVLANDNIAVARPLLRHSPTLLIGILQAGRTDLFEILVGKVTGLDTYALRHVLYDPNGKALATICRAMGLPRKQFVELYLLVLRSQADSEATLAREIGAVGRHFFRITPSAALEAIADRRGDDRLTMAERADSTSG